MKLINRKWVKPSTGTTFDRMVGYKATTADMTCRGYQFELGKTYTAIGQPVACWNGFHFCQQLQDVFGYYYPSINRHMRIFRVVASGYIVQDLDKYASSNIRLIEEVSIEYLMEHYRDYVAVGMLAAQRGYMLDSLINDNRLGVRIEVARQGYGLDKLINDHDPTVRVEVARQGYGLDKLINDPHSSVRCEVANQGYGLDKLINDHMGSVRYSVANRGYGLDILINDCHPRVREAVARQSYGFDILINDSDGMVRDTARRYKNRQIVNAIQ